MAKPTVLTVGTFDGVHLGHQFLLKEGRALAERSGMPFKVATFDPHPRTVLGQMAPGFKLLNSPAERDALLKAHGADEVVVLPFDAEVASTDYHDFAAHTLVKQLGMKLLVMGHDHRLGRARAGGFAEMTALGEELGYKVVKLPPIDLGGVHLSSSAIRKALQQGDVQQANALLGYNYQIEGTVVHGKKLGRTLGFPTANLGDIFDWKLIPGDGVYLARARVGGKVHNALVSIGTNPTFDERERQVEAYLIEYDGDLYGQKIILEMLMKLRGQLKFANRNLLIAQMETDAQVAGELFLSI